MKFNATYNFLVLLFLYAFCCTVVRGIEALYGVNLQMAVVYYNVWSASAITLLLAPLVIFWTCKDGIDESELPSSNGIIVATKIFNMFWLISLLTVVMGNIATSVKSFLIGELGTKPFLLGLLINAFAVFAFCASYFTSNNRIQLRSYKIAVSTIVALLSCITVFIAQACLPVQYLRAVHKDGIRHDMLCDIEREIKKNPDWTPDQKTWSVSGTWYDKIAKAIEIGNISLAVVDDTHVKMSWKRDIEPDVLDKTGSRSALLHSYKYSYYDWGCYYKQTEKIVEMEAKIEKKRKENPESKDKTTEIPPLPDTIVRR